MTFYDGRFVDERTDSTAAALQSGPPQRYEGKLELTWTNKSKALLAHEDSSYEWVPSSDYRVAEVRLFREAETVGEVRAEPARAKDNLLIRGDALHALTSLLSIPEYAREYAGKVKLVYLDPPFNTQQAFQHYDDALEHSVWLTMMRDRLEQVKELLADDGSVWVHLDDTELAYCRVMMDEVFGRNNFVAGVVWEKSDSPRMDAKLFSSRHDTILVYRRSPSLELNQLVATAAGHAKFTDDMGRRYYLNPLRARGRAATRQDARTCTSLSLRQMAPRSFLDSPMDEKVDGGGAKSVCNEMQTSSNGERDEEAGPPTTGSMRRRSGGGRRKRSGRTPRLVQIGLAQAK